MAKTNGIPDEKTFISGSAVLVGDNYGTVCIINGDISNSEVVQGNGTITGTKTGAIATTKEEAEILRIYNALDVRCRCRFLTLAFEIEKAARMTA